MHNVIVFGESGVGKSSIVNLVVGSQAARTSPDADACTTRTKPYDVTIDGIKYKLWDTPGLDGGSFGLFRAAIVERNLKTVVRKLLKKNEPSLLIYCVRASRATRALVRHYQSVRYATRDSPVPIAIVVTGLENSRGDMEDWWHKNAAGLSDHGMEFVDHACITSVDDDPRDLVLVRRRRTSSRDAVRDLISRNCIPHEQRQNTPPPPAKNQGDTRGWSWVVWTYLVSNLLPGHRG